MGMTTSGTVPVQDGKLYYEVKGKGHPLILIHAGFLDRRMWDEQFELFSNSYNVVRYDVRGFGSSPRLKPNSQTLKTSTPYYNISNSIRCTLSVSRTGEE